MAEEQLDLQLSARVKALGQDPAWQLDAVLAFCELPKAAKLRLFNFKDDAQAILYVNAAIAKGKCGMCVTSRAQRST